MPVDSGHAVRLVGWTHLGLSGYINILTKPPAGKQKPNSGTYNFDEISERHNLEDSQI